MDKHDFIALLKDLKKKLKGKRLLLIWDGLPAHRAGEVKTYLRSQKYWLRIERYPAYAPELSALEPVWASMKTTDLAHVPPKGLPHLKKLVRRAFRRIKRDKTLLKHCLREVGC